MASSYVGLQAALNVKDFGAIGDGSTNDTAAIQGAINALPGPGSGGTIYFPPGTYVCTTTITLRAGVHLVGSGYQSTILSFSGAIAGVQWLEGSGGTAGNVSVRNLTVDGTTGAGTTRMIEFRNLTNIQIDNCRIINGDYGIYLANCWAVSITNCALEEFEDYGIFLGDSTYGASQGVHISGCHVSSSLATASSDAGIGIQSAGYVTVAGCRISGLTAAPTVIVLNAAFQTTFTNCVVTDCTDSCVKGLTTESTGVTFDGCYFSTSGNVSYLNFTSLAHAALSVRGCYFAGIGASDTCFHPGTNTTSYEFVNNFASSTPAAYVGGIGSATTQNVRRFADRFQFDDEVQLRASGVAHGITGVEPTDIFGRFKPISTADGGLDVVGLTEQGRALNLFGFATTEDTASDATARGNIEFDAYLKSGTGGTTHGTTANLVVIRNGGSTRFIFKGNGDSYSDGSGWTNYDSHDDVALLTGLCVVAAPSTDPLRRQFLAFVDEHKARLQALGLIEFSAEGRIFVNHTRVEMLLAGAVRQIAQRLTVLETPRTRVRGWRAILSSVVRRASRNTWGAQS